MNALIHICFYLKLSMEPMRISDHKGMCVMKYKLKELELQIILHKLPSVKRIIRNFWLSCNCVVFHCSSVLTVSF